MFDITEIPSLYGICIFSFEVFINKRLLTMLVLFKTQWEKKINLSVFYRKLFYLWLFYV
jgi:hypothetical protein